MIQLHDRCLSFHAMVLVRPLLGDAYTALYARPPSKTITLWGYVGLRANEADAYFAAKRSTAWGSDDRDESRRAWGPRRRSIQRWGTAPRATRPIPPARWAYHSSEAPSHLVRESRVHGVILSG